jgi:hypothetical protein
MMGEEAEEMRSRAKCWVVAIACAPIQDVKGWQPPLLNELEFGSHQC